MKNKPELSKVISAWFFSLFAVSGFTSLILLADITDGTWHIMFFAFIAAWVTDSCALITGLLFGKHKLLPSVSPKKTIEGAVGGVLGAGLLGFLYSLIARHFVLTDNNLSLIFAVVCMVGALLSIIGDLAASAIKRNYEIKDYGTLIPGHGGIMDRFDSVIFTAPMIYFLVIIFL
jgi:phosphatidate cytidylyltransferase